MKRNISINVGNLFLSLSDALDLATPKLVQHQQRTAFITFEMGQIAGLSEELLEQMFYAALLHDIGAFSVEGKVALLSSEVENTEDHCIRGERIIKELDWLKQASEFIRFHHRFWEEWKEWHKTIDIPFVLGSQIISLADYLERQIDRQQYILYQNKQLITHITSLAGKNFHADVVDYFVSVASREEFWLDMVSPRLYSYLLHNGPSRRLDIGLADLSSISKIFANIIDFRSRFTATHSSGVAACATLLSKIFGLTEAEIFLMEVAGNLHDLGKLFVPNQILEKPGRLDVKEFDVIKAHTYFTYSVLNTIGGLQQIAEWAAYHHERLDGSGYPFHCKSEELTTGSRIMMVADIFTALAEDRPYRKGMSKEGIERIIGDFASRELLDKRIVNLLFDKYEEIDSYVKDRQNLARQFYEKQFAFIPTVNP